MKGKEFFVFALNKIPVNLLRNSIKIASYDTTDVHFPSVEEWFSEITNSSGVPFGIVKGNDGELAIFIEKGDRSKLTEAMLKQPLQMGLAARAA